MTTSDHALGRIKYRCAAFATSELMTSGCKIKAAVKPRSAIRVIDGSGTYRNATRLIPGGIHLRCAHTKGTTMEFLEAAVFMSLMVGNVLAVVMASSESASDRPRSAS
jgi:hypothetical protein